MKRLNQVTCWFAVNGLPVWLNESLISWLHAALTLVSCFDLCSSRVCARGYRNEENRARKLLFSFFELDFIFATLKSVLRGESVFSQSSLRLWADKKWLLVDHTLNEPNSTMMTNLIIGCLTVLITECVSLVLKSMKVWWLACLSF